MTRAKKSPLLPRFLAGSAYFVCMLQWLWIIILVLPTLIDSGLLASFAPPRVEKPQVAIVDDTSQSPLLLITGGIVTLLMIVLTIYILIKFPSKVAQNGSTIAHKAADVIVPVVSHHKPISPKKRRTLTARVLFYVKLALVLAPVLACYLVPETNTINADLIRFIGSILAMIAVGLFALEYATLYALFRSATRSTHAS